MDAATSDKETAKRRCSRLRRIGTLLRCLETIAAAAALLLSWSSARLISAELLRHLAAVLLGPRFVFLLANAIVLVLLAESGHLSPSPSSPTGGHATALHEELLGIRRRVSDSLPAPPPQREEEVFEDKAACSEPRAIPRIRSERAGQRRRAPPEFRGPETDVGSKKAVAETPAVVEEEEEEDAEEFRRTIEAFIAKQAKFHREESMKAIVSGGASCSTLFYSAGSPELCILK